LPWIEAEFGLPFAHELRHADRASQVFNENVDAWKKPRPGHTGHSDQAASEAAFSLTNLKIMVLFVLAADRRQQKRAAGRGVLRRLISQIARRGGSLSIYETDQ
jgi:hypothetical protein